MTKTVTALYENYPKANSAVQDLVNHGFQRDEIGILVQEAHAKDGVLISEEETSGVAAGAGIGAAIGGVGALVLGLSALAIPGIGPIIAAGPLVAALVGAGVGAAAGGVIGALTDVGVPEEEAHYYAEGVSRGGVLVTVHAADDLAERAASVLATHHPIDLPRRVQEWRQSGWSRFDADGEPAFLAHSTAASTHTPDTVHDTKERKNRPLFLQAEHTRTPDKAYDSKAHTVVTAVHQTREPERTPTHDTAQETTIPVVEEALQVGKRQTERDVHVRTTGTETPAEEHTETVRDTVRRTDVQVDQTGTAPQKDIKGFEVYDADFRRHYEIAFATTSGSTYGHYLPAYRYGYTLATDKRYTGRDWTMIEPEARRAWEEGHAGTWEQFKDEIRHAWDTVSGRR